MLMRPGRGAIQKSLWETLQCGSCEFPAVTSSLLICLQVVCWPQRKSSNSFSNMYISQVCNTICDSDRATIVHFLPVSSYSSSFYGYCKDSTCLFHSSRHSVNRTQGIRVKTLLHSLLVKHLNLLKLHIYLLFLLYHLV